MKKLEKLPLHLIALLQSLALLVYVGFVAAFMNKADDWFSDVPNFVSIMLFLSVFVTSALISATIVLGYPAYLFWKNKSFAQSIKLVLFTVAWLVSCVVVFVLVRIIS